MQFRECFLCKKKKRILLFNRKVDLLRNPLDNVVRHFGEGKYKLDNSPINLHCSLFHRCRLQRSRFILDQCQRLLFPSVTQTQKHRKIGLKKTVVTLLKNSIHIFWLVGEPLTLLFSIIFKSKQTPLTVDISEAVSSHSICHVSFTNLIYFEPKELTKHTAHPEITISTTLWQHVKVDLQSVTLGFCLIHCSSCTFTCQCVSYCAKG